MKTQYDAIVIGAGMSGLGAAIRLSMFDKKVLLLEKHSISGGLNSYYSRRLKDTKEELLFDVGLHALTNFAQKGERKKPFTKMLKQLRLSYDDFELNQQTYSKIQFKSASLNFSNDFELLKSEIAKTFPTEIDPFNKFVSNILEFNEVDLTAQYQSARAVLARYFKEPLLMEMLIAPLLIYGSAWEDDMDFSQFVIMFKSIYLEGFSRPKGGVRTILKLLLDRAKEVGVEIRFNTQVTSILDQNGKVVGVQTKKGETIFTDKIFSSVGLPETYALTKHNEEHPVGKMSFMETILVTDNKNFLKNTEPTIIFYNDSDQYLYRKSSDLYDNHSAVFCLPDNYERNSLEGYGTIRLTYMANFDKWNELDRKTYLLKKDEVFESALQLTCKLIPDFNNEIIFKDVFSPTTIKRYTNHLKGTVYGSTEKSRDGRSKYEGLYIIGTDQGFLGIVGSVLSGISMANYHGLMEQL